MRQFRERIAKEYLKMVNGGTIPKVAIIRLTAKYQVHRSTIYRNVSKIKDKV